MDRRSPRRDSLRSPRWVVASVALALVGVLAWAVRRGRATGRPVPISPVIAGWFVGPKFVERRGLATGEPVAGELDDLSALASESFDPTKVDPAVRAFYEQTGTYRLRYRTTWHRPFRSGAALATRLTRRIEQLNLPGPDDHSWHDLESRFFAVSEPSDRGRVESDPGREDDESGREDVRAWVRTDPATGAAVFVALYATHRHDGERLVNIAAPLPGGNVSTVLRPELLDEGADRPTGLRFSTHGDGDPGLYLQTPLGPVTLPAEQEFRVWRLGDEETPAGGDDRRPLGAVHEMWFLGRRFLTVDYELNPREESDRTERPGGSDDVTSADVDEKGESGQTSTSTS